MNEEFIFRVGADVSGFTKSISDVERELKKVQTELKTKTGAAIVETNKYIADLQSSLVNLRSTGLSKLPQAANQGAASLNALSQVARDAPFGFIAIQNNLPILFDSFGSLAKQSGGLVGALKNVGATLAGPAGITFAIGAVIAGATALIQKYGSISEAAKVLLGSSKEITETQKAYNKSIYETTGNLVAEDAKVQALTKTLLNQKAPQADRLAAYGELKKISPDVVAGIKDENALTSESNLLIEANAKARKELLRLKIQESGINAALTTNATLLAEANAELTKAEAEVVVVTKKLNNSQKTQTNQSRVAEQGINTYALELKNLKGNIENIKKEIAALTKTEQTYIDQLDPIANGIAKINENTRQRVDNLKKETKAEAEGLKKREKAIALREEQIRVDNLYNTKAKIRQQAESFQVELDGIRQVAKERRKGEREAGIILPKEISGIVPAFNNEKFLSTVRSTNNELQRLKEEANLSAAYNLMNQTFFSPIENLFENFLNTGKFAFKEFAQSILKAINQIVAKIIATGIITLLASLFIPGFSAAGGGIGQTLVSGILGSLGFSAPSRVAAPSFGGVSGGAMQMAGAVNLSLRGSDLVGSINRTNATISRVG